MPYMKQVNLYWLKQEDTSFQLLTGHRMPHFQYPECDPAWYSLLTSYGKVAFPTFYVTKSFNFYLLPLRLLPK